MEVTVRHYKLWTAETLEEDLQPLYADNWRVKEMTMGISNDLIVVLERDTNS